MGSIPTLSTMLSINSENEIKKIDLNVNIAKSKITNERQYVLSLFVEEINKERIGTKFKPITGRAVAMKVSLLKTNYDLYAFLSICKDYKNRHGSFGKRFWGGGKIKKVVELKDGIQKWDTTQNERHN